MTREFVTAAKHAEKKSDVVTIDGREVTIFHPAEGQMTLLMATMGRGRASDMEAIATFINMVTACLDDESRVWVESRLLDRDDDYGLEEIEQLGEYIIELVSGRPLDGRSASTPSPTPTGPSSTPTTPAQTSSPFHLTGS